MHFLESQLEALETQHSVKAETISELCAFYHEDEADALAQLRASLQRVSDILGNGNPDQLEPLLRQKDVYPHITRRAKVNRRAEPLTELNRLSPVCRLQVESEVLRLRFVYEDSPDSPVQNGHVIYWLYDNHPERPDTIEQDANAFFQKAQLMMPIGIGMTDKEGYLIQSVPLPESRGLHHIKSASNQIMVKPSLSPWKKMQLLSGKARYDRKAYDDLVNGELNQWSNTRAFGDILLNYNGQFRGEMSEAQYLSQLNQRRPLLKHKTILTVQEQVMANLIAQGFQEEDSQAINDAMQLMGWDEFKARQFTRQVSNQYFYRNRRYGFLLYPADRGNFVSKDLTTLTQDIAQPTQQSTSSPINRNGAAWAEKELPEPDRSQKVPYSTIKIYCTLPEWDRRLSKQLAKLEEAHRQHQKLVQPHRDHLLRIQQMERLTALYGNYHSEPLNQEEHQTIEALSEDLGAMHDTLETWLLEQTDTDDFPLTQSQNQIDQAAEALWTTLNIPAFATELQRYLAVALQHEGGADVINPGPYMESEPFWPHIFETLGNCYAAFRNTSIEERAWEQHLEPMVCMVAQSGERRSLEADNKVLEDISEITRKHYFDEPRDNNILAPLLERLDANMDKKIELDDRSEPERSPLLIAMEAYRKTANAAFHNLPGPPSMMQVVLDVYADYVSNLVRKHSVGKNAFHIKLFFGVMRLYGLSPQGAEFNDFKHSIYKLLRAHGRQYAPGGRKPKGGKNKVSRDAMRVVNEAFFRHFPEIETAGQVDTRAQLSDQAYGARNYLQYKSAMQVMNWMLLFETWGNLSEDGKMDEDGILRYIANIADTSGNTLLKAIQTRQLVGQFLAARGVSPPITRYAKLADAIAQRLNILACVMATADAYQYYRHGLYGKSVQEIIRAASLGMLTYGHAVKKWSQSAAGHSAQKAAVLTSKRGGRWLAKRGAAWGAGILFVPVVGEAAFIIGAVVGVGLALIDSLSLISDVLRSPLHQQFHANWNNFIGAKMTTGNRVNKRYLDFYTGDMPLANRFKAAYAGADAKRETSMLIEDSAVDWASLTWRAIVPLYLRGYSIDEINQLITFSADEPRYTGGEIEQQGGQRIEKTLVAYMDVSSIIEFYNRLNTFDGLDFYDSGRTYDDVRRALDAGTFTPKLDEPQPTFGIKDPRLGLDAPVSWQHRQFLD